MRVEVLEAINDPPTACFFSDPSRPAVGTPVRFSGRCSFDPDGSIVSWSWDFGDGTVAEGPEVIHAYAALGTYLVTLTVTDDGGASSQTQAVITVAENLPPVASFWFSPENPAVNETVYFNGWDSYDPDGYIVTWYWDFEGGGNATAFGPEAWYAFPTGGDHLVTLTVVDDAGASSNASAIVHVNEPPVAVISTPSPTAKVGTPIAFDGTASYDTDGVVARYVWDFGDGSGGEGAVVRHVYGQPTAYDVRLTVVDDRGAAGSTVASIAVLEPKPPVAIIGWSPSRPRVGQDVTFDGTFSLDPDGSVATWIWQFGDGGVALGAVVTHAYGHAGTYTVKLTVIDEDGLVDEDAWEVTVVTAPITGRIVSFGLTPIAGATVSFFSGGSLAAEAVTEADGSFSLAPLPAGSYDVEVSRDGYRKIRMTVTLDGGGRDLGMWILAPEEEPKPLAIPIEIIAGAVAAGGIGAAAIVARWSKARRARPSRGRG